MQRKVRRQKSRGQAVVEFALVLPVFLLLTLGVVDMARIFTAYISLTNGVANAALYAAQGGYDKWCVVTTTIHCVGGPGPVVSADPNNIAYQIEVETTALTPSLVDFLAPQCTPTAGPAVPCAHVAAGTYSKVQIVANYQVSMFTPLMNVLLGGPVRMSAATTAATY